MNDEEFFVDNKREKKVPSREKPELGVPQMYLQSNQADESNLNKKQSLHTESEDENLGGYEEVKGNRKKVNQKQVEAPKQPAAPQPALDAKKPAQKFFFKLSYD